MTAASSSRGRPALSAGAQRSGTTAGGSPPRSDKLPLSPRRAGTFRGVGHTILNPGRTQGSNPTGPLSRGNG